MSLFSAYYEFTRAQFLLGTSNIPSYTVIDNFQQFLFTAANYGTGTWYYESVLLSDGTNTVYSALFDDSGVQLANSEISTTSSNLTLQRSAAITMADGDEYSPRIRTSTTITTDFGVVHARLIFDANYTSELSPVESHIQLWGWWNYGWISWGAYEYPLAGNLLLNADTFYYNPKNWESGTLFYFEATLSVASGFTGKAIVASGGDINNTSNISASEVTTTSTAPVRLRSAAFTPVDNAYHQLGTSSTGANSSQAVSCDNAKIIAVVPTGTKFELHHPLSSGFENSNHTSYVKYVASRVRFNEATWTEHHVQGVFFESIMSVDNTLTASQALAYWTGPTTDFAIDGTEISYTATTGSLLTAVRGGNIKNALFTLDFSAILQARWKVSSGSTIDFISGGKLIYVYNRGFDLDLDSGGTGFDLSLAPVFPQPEVNTSDTVTITENVAISKMPAVVTYAATSVAGTSAQLNGEVLDDGL